MFKSNTLILITQPSYFLFSPPSYTKCFQNIIGQNKEEFVVIWHDVFVNKHCASDRVY